MTSYLIDINVWLALTWDQHPQHKQARVWFESTGNSVFLFCRTTMLGLLRLLTNERVMGGSTATVAEALEIFDQWKADPRVEMSLEVRSTEGAFLDALRPYSQQSATKAVMDCYLVGFAESSKARIVTFDKELATTAQLRNVPSVLLNASEANQTP